jgi:hypothetical protein
VISFLSPLFLIGAAAAAVPIVLHLLRRETEARVKFPTVRLLKHGPVEDVQRRRLRELLLLALRVGALCLLAVAFARPFFAASGAQPSGVTVVALDTSLSMSAPGRFERAKQLAIEAINRAPADDEVGVVSFGESAAILSPLGDGRPLAIAAVEGTSTGFESTRYRAAFNTVSEMIRARGGGRATIIVVTDLQESGWDEGDRAALPEAAQVEVADVGALPANLAVTGVRIDGDRIVATVRAVGSEAREARVRLVVDGRTVGEDGASLAPDQFVEVTLPGARGVTASVSVDDPQGIQGDNTRHLVLSNTGRPAVLVVTTNGDLVRDAFYVQQALLAAGADGAVYQVEPAAARDLTAWDSQRLDRYTAAVLLSTRGIERTGRDRLSNYLRGGGGLLAAAGQDIDRDVLRELLEGALSLTPATVGAGGSSVPRALTPADIRHPIFQAFGAQASTLGLVKFNQITMIGGTGCQPLARFTTGEPALVECAAGAGSALVLASDLNNVWNDFPLHTAFVPFLHEAVRFLGVGRGRQSDYLIGEAPAGVPLKPGIANVSDGAGSLHPIAVNVDPIESDPARLSVAEFQAAVTRLKDTGDSVRAVEARRQEDRQHIWQYLLAVMITMLVVESLVARRTA